ncbi:MAG: hypothetical protein LQ348_003720 [Seirophora lacunosa]|nr:MAG: hypothetical protein LQ348_003720 [Seirophora lacunosa]
MVLEASQMSDSSDAFYDTPDPYASDLQPYASGANVDRTRLPKPLPVLGPLFGFNETRMASVSAERLKNHAKVAERPLTQKETEAVMYHSYKAMAITSYGNPIAVGFGLFRTYRTRDTYRFPYYGALKTEDGFWDGHRIRVMGRDLMEGAQARLGVHILRGCAYGLVTYLLGSLFVTSYTSTVTAVGEARDPRLQDFREIIKAKMKREIEASAPTRQPRDPMGQGNTNAAELWKRHRQGTEPPDDASPSADTDFYDGITAGTNTGTMSDAQMRTQETRQQASPRTSPTENTASTFEIQKVERQPIGFEDDSDDASPTAQNGTDDNQGGSAWDRLRRQAQKQASGTKEGGRGWNAIRKEQQEGSTTGDSFTFSSADRERQLAQDEAQKNFDARVERERQGGDFNENRGRRW